MLIDSCLVGINFISFLANSRSDLWTQSVNGLSRFNYRALQVGVLLLAAGTILGGVWADYAWGRFWGWDPKEVWALVALLAYVAVLHARHTGWLGNFGLAAWSVVSFATVVTLPLKYLVWCGMTLWQ